MGDWGDDDDTAQEVEVVETDDDANVAEKGDHKGADDGKLKDDQQGVPPVPPQRYQRPKPLPEVKVPTAAEVASHNLTHLPYRRWCMWCVMARRRNNPHWQRPPFSRDIPLLVFDYCFVRNASDQDLITVLVAKLYPFHCIFAVQCDVKGEDEYATTRLATFLRHCGVQRCTYMCDQESSIDVMMQAAIQIRGCQGKWAGAVPETGAVGESQSNSRAERAVQTLEDQLRTLKAALESRIQARVPSTHPVVRWLIEYSATILNKYQIQDVGDQEAFATSAR